MSSENMQHSVRAVNRGVEDTSSQVRVHRDPALDALDVIIGRWINEGHTLNTGDAESMRIVTSDVYEWAPGRFHVVHAAYGPLAGTDVGGTEIITFDPRTGGYTTYFFDSHGNVSTHRLSIDGDIWRWQGESTRCTAVFSQAGRIQSALHERTDDGGATWLPTMQVTLRKIV
jgi:hypothetical protein